LFDTLVDTRAVPVDSSMDSNHELDRIFKARNLLILKVAEVVKSVRSRGLVQKVYKEVFLRFCSFADVD
jgi:hypothetical protein